MTRQIARYLLIILLLALCTFALFSTASAQDRTPSATVTPLPTPMVLTTPEAMFPLSPFEVCIDKGTFIAQAYCLIKTYGLRASFILLVTLFIIYFFFVPAGKVLQEEMKIKFKRIFRISTTPKEEFSEEELTLPTIQPAQKPEKYLDWLEARTDPSHEKEFFIPLKEGLDPRLELMEPTAGSEQRPFTEHRTFEDLTEAMSYINPATKQTYPAFALLGEPGSGKTTLLRKLVRDSIARCRTARNAPIPFFVSLGDFRKRTPLNFLREQWNKAVAFCSLDQVLSQGRLWLFADGLNEMERKSYNKSFLEWVDLFHSLFQSSGNRAIVACRTADYEELRLPSLLVHPLDDNRIKVFLKKRIPALHQIVWDEIELDRRERRGDLYRLAQTPFWLVLMTRVASDKGLPHNRAALVSEFLFRLSANERNRPNACIREISEWSIFIDALTSVAWHGMFKSPHPTFTEKEILKYFAARGLPANSLLKTTLSCGLFVRKEKGFQFQHQLFQEYFAGRELKRQFQKRKNLNRLWRITRRCWRYKRSSWEPLPNPQTGWEETTLIAAGMLNISEAKRLTLSVLKQNAPLAARCVIESDVETGEDVQKAVAVKLKRQIENPRQRLAARLAAGKALGRLGDERILAKQHEALMPSVKSIKFIEPDWVDIPAGTFQMGSSGKDKRRLKNQKIETYPGEEPTHLVTISHGYKIGRFPVTVEEYRCFKDSGGYMEKSYWPDEASRRWLNGKMEFEESYQYYWHKVLRAQVEQLLPQLKKWEKEGRWAPYQAQGLRQRLEMSEDSLRQEWQRLESEKRDQKGHAYQSWLWDDPRYKIPNQPVVGICWYEARAYTLWLTSLLRQAKRITGEMEVSLPTEAEWEYAARGPNGRLWPWGNHWKKEACNSLEGRVQFPSPVGIYPVNVSPCKAMDMAGNVWEWCVDWYAEDTYEKRKDKEVVDPPGPETGSLRVLRGGSFSDARDNARCACRGRDDPGGFNGYIGFRVVLSPIIKSEI